MTCKTLLGRYETSGSLGLALDLQGNVSIVGCDSVLLHDCGAGSTTSITNSLKVFIMKGY